MDSAYALLIILCVVAFGFFVLLTLANPQPATLDPSQKV